MEQKLQGSISPSITNIVQLDGMADSETESLDETHRIINETPGNNDEQEYGLPRTKIVQYPKGIAFYSDPSKPADEIIYLGNAPQLQTPPMRQTVEESEVEEDAEG